MLIETSLRYTRLPDGVWFCDPKTGAPLVRVVNLLPPGETMTKAQDIRVGDIVECRDAEGADPHLRHGYFYRVSDLHGACTDIFVDGKSGSWMRIRFRLAFRPPEGEVWEPWNGGEPPVGGLTPVRAAYRNGEADYFDAGSRRWTHPNGSTPAWDIIAYRVIDAPATETSDGLTQGGEPKPIDLSKLRRGDKVLAWMEVDTFNLNDDICTIYTSPKWIGRAEIIDVQHALKNGDTVTVEDLIGEFKVLAIAGDHAWLQQLDGSAFTPPPCTKPITKLTRV